MGPSVVVDCVFAMFAQRIRSGVNLTDPNGSDPELTAVA